MNCLTDGELQAVADNEATVDQREHVVECDVCHDRMTARRAAMGQITAQINDATLPSEIEPRLRFAMRHDRPVRGATAMRAALPSRWWRRQATWISAAATGVVIAVVMFGILPRFGAPTTLSAAEVLGRSLQTLSATTGIERLQYELVVDGVLSGPHRIEQLIDHARPAHYRVANYRPDGVLESALSQDPATGTRTQLIRVDDRNYIVRVKSLRSPVLSAPQMVQAQFEAVIGMMQATADQKLTVLGTPDRPQYVVEVPPMASSGGAAAMLDLNRARAVIDGSTFQIQEFEASGVLLKQPYSMSYRLVDRSIRSAAEVRPEEFEIQADAGDVVLEGEASGDPLSEMLATVLRELGRAKGY